MRKQFPLFLTITLSLLLLLSCGGGKPGKDSKADFQMDEKALKAAEDKALNGSKEYEDKIIEMKGIVKGVKIDGHSAAPNKYVFSLCSDASQEESKGTICYTDSDITASTGKPVTVKGKFSYAGVVTLIDCVVY